MELSDFGARLCQGAGILHLMDDLGQALAAGDKIMMGGGNPGQVPEIQELMRRRLQGLIDDEQSLRRLIGIYDPPRGEGEMLRALAGMLRREYGWDLDEENICLTCGSQGAFFLLFNMLAGQCGEKQRKILLPLAPEYIGYADLGLCDGFFRSFQPVIEELDPDLFKYRVDFSQLEVADDVAAICVSRPTNPTGNVLTDGEVQGLVSLAAARRIPLILDNAYGLPFPGMIYTEATPIWNEHIILCLSLSKFGLPATRTGIVIASKEIIRLLSGLNAVVTLAPGSFGAMLVSDLIQSGEIIRVSKEIIRPFYKNKMERALAALRHHFQGLSYKVHVPEGSMFFWLWLPGLPISSQELYARLKAKGVVVVPGEHFFPGLLPGWQHSRECLRLTYSQDDNEVQRGLEIIAGEIRSLT